MVVKLQSKEKEEDSFESEIYAGIAMNAANIPGVVRVLGYMKNYDQEHHAIVFENGGRYWFGAHRQQGLSTADATDIISQVLNTVMHVHLNTETTHGDVAEHNIVYSTAEVEGETRCLASLIDFGNAGFKDAHGVFSIPERITEGMVDPYVYFKNVARRSGVYPGGRWGSSGKDGWLTDAYAVGKMFADVKQWKIHHLCGLAPPSPYLNEADGDLYELVSHLVAQKVSKRWGVDDVVKSAHYERWRANTIRGAKVLRLAEEAPPSSEPGSGSSDTPSDSPDKSNAAGPDTSGVSGQPVSQVRGQQGTAGSSSSSGASSDVRVSQSVYSAGAGGHIRNGSAAGPDTSRVGGQPVPQVRGQQGTAGSSSSSGASSDVPVSRSVYSAGAGGHIRNGSAAGPDTSRVGGQPVPQVRGQEGTAAPSSPRGASSDMSLSWSVYSGSAGGHVRNGSAAGPDTSSVGGQPVSQARGQEGTAAPSSPRGASSDMSLSWSVYSGSAGGHVRNGSAGKVGPDGRARVAEFCEAQEVIGSAAADSKSDEHTNEDSDEDSDDGGNNSNWSIGSEARIVLGKRSRGGGMKSDGPTLKSNSRELMGTAAPMGEGGRRRNPSRAARRGRGAPAVSIEAPSVSTGGSRKRSRRAGEEGDEECPRPKRAPVVTRSMTKKLLESTAAGNGACASAERSGDSN